MAGAERAVQLKVVGVRQESAPDGKQDILRLTDEKMPRRRISSPLYFLSFHSCQPACIDYINTREQYLELVGLIERIKVRFKSHGLFQTLQEEPLERHDFLDVAEQGVDFGSRQERLLLQRFQIVFQQVVQVL